MESHPNSNGRPRLKPASAPLMIAAAASVALLVVILDQAVKNLIVFNHQANGLIARARYASLVFVANTGGVCGYAQGSNTILIFIGVLTITVISVSILYFMPDRLPHSAAFGLLLAGALGNLIDRLRFGYVVDYITLDFLGWPSFNIADISILAGIGFIGLLTMWEMLQERKVEQAAESQPLGWNTIIFLIIAGLLLAAAYVLCVFRPFG